MRPFPARPVAFRGGRAAPSAGPWRRSRSALVASSLARCVLGMLTLLLAVSVLPAVIGWQTSVVMSGSMEPTLQPGDVVIVRPVSQDELSIGDVVLVDDPDVPGELRIHRIAGRADGRLQLRGDANPQPDTSLVEPTAVRGVGALRLPHLGLVALWGSQGRVLPIAGAGATLAALVALSMFHRLPADPAGRPAGPPGPGSAGRGRTRARRAAAGGLVVLVLLTPVAIAGVGARFSSVTANPPASFTAAKAWTCADAVLQRNAQADQYYPLQETAGPTATNIGALGSGASATYSAAGVRHAAPGPNCGGPTRSAVALDGVAGSIWTDRAVTDPDKFTLQVWFSTTTTTGGLLVGLGDGVDGAASTQYDRQVYMTPAGKVVFGLYDKGGVVHAVTSPASYNDGRWHLVTASYFFGPGMRLMVDGVEIGRDASIGSTTAYTGRWRAGYDAINPSWPGAPASGWFAGSLAHLAVFPFPMVQADAAVQYGVGPWTCAQAAGSGGANATRYWPLQESSGPTATNSGSAGALGNGTYAGTGVGLSVAGPPCGPGSGAAVHLDGQAGTVWTAQAVKAQPQFSEQIWFSTTTTSGGPLISFGAGPNGALSSQSDRNLYMSADGRLVAGVNGAAPSTVISPTPYNDGRWHLATVTFSPVTGLRLYVDGALVREAVVITAVPTPSWYWRIGSGDLSAWPTPPGSSYFAGSVAHASVYDNVLSDAEVSSAAAAGSG